MNTVASMIEERIESDAAMQVQEMLTALWFAAGKILADAGLPNSDHGIGGHNLQRALLNIYGAPAELDTAARQALARAAADKRREAIVKLVTEGA